MASTTLRPNSDITTTNVTGLGSGSSPYWDDVNEGVGSQDGDGVENQSATSCVYEVDLTNAPADFLTANSLDIKTYLVFGGTLGYWDVTLEVDLRDSGDTSLIGGFKTVYDTIYDTQLPSDQLVTNQVSSPTAGNKSTYDGAKLYYKWTALVGPSITIGVDLADVIIDYDAKISLEGDGRTSARPTADLTATFSIAADGRSSARPTASLGLTLALAGDGRAAAQPTASLEPRTYLSGDGRSAAQPTANLSQIQVGYPGADTQKDGWDSAPTPSQDLYLQIDEDPVSDTDYIHASA